MTLKNTILIGILSIGAIGASIAAPMMGDISVPINPGVHTTFPEAREKMVTLHCYLSGESQIQQGTVDVKAGDQTRTNALTSSQKEFVLHNIKTKNGELAIKTKSSSDLRMVDSAGDNPYLMYCHYQK